MAYRLIELPPATPPEVLALVRRRIDLFCADVNAMLHLPLPGQNITAGCNFAATESLCSIISGISRVFLDPHLGSARAFKTILEFYPDEDLLHATPKAELIEQLYKTHRCNFAHSLGINVPDPETRGHPRRIEPLERRTKVIRLEMGQGSEALASLESNGERPTWLPPTISREDGVDVLCVESLYWGVRQLVTRVATHEGCCQRATEFLRTAYPNQGDDAPYPPVRHIPLNTSITFEVSSSAAMVAIETSMMQVSRSIPRKDDEPRL